MSEYITDPELLAELEGKKKKPSSKGYVTDPKLLAELNKAPEPESALQTLGRSTASLADTLVNTATGLVDIPSRAAIRAYQGTVGGKSLPEAERIAQQYGTFPKDTFGRAFNVTGTPGYENAPLRSLGTMAGQAIGENVIQPMAQATGLPEGYVGDVASIGAAGVAPGIPKVARPIAQAAAAPVKGAVGFGKGFARGVAYPEGTSPQSALAPIRETYVPREQVQQFMAGNRPASTLTEVPTAPLYQNKPVANWAYGMAPENQAGQKLVPYAGRTAEGIGEQIGSQYRTNPLTGLIDVATTIGTGGTIPAPLALGRASTALASRQLQKATQFEPGFGPARAAALQREGQMGLQANMPPTQNLLPAPGPVAPMVANQTGQVTAPGGRPLPTQASGQPVTQPAGPTPQQMAIQRTQQIVAQRQQQSQKVAGPVQPQPMPQQTRMPQVAPQPKPKPQPQPIPKVAGTRPSTEIRKELNMISRQSDDLHQTGLESGIKYGTPEGESYQAQLGQLNARTKVLEKELEQALKLEKKATKK